MKRTTKQALGIATAFALAVSVSATTHAEVLALDTVPGGHDWTGWFTTGTHSNWVEGNAWIWLALGTTGYAVSDVTGFQSPPFTTYASVYCNNGSTPYWAPGSTGWNATDGDRVVFCPRDQTATRSYHEFYKD